MAPRCAAFLGASVNLGIVVKLVVPDYIVEGTVINLVEGGSQRVGGCVAHAIAAQLKDVMLAAGTGKLLAERFVTRCGLHGAAERARSARSGGAAWQKMRVELEYEPPVHRMGSFEKRHRRGIRSLGIAVRIRRQGDEPEANHCHLERSYQARIRRAAFHSSFLPRSDRNLPAG